MKRLVSAGLALFLVFAGSAFPQAGRGRGGTRRPSTAAGGRQQNTPEGPLANFVGVVRGSSSKSLTMEDPDSNIVQFDCSRKTRYFDKGKAIKASALKPADRVSVEARRTLDGRLEAVNVRREQPQPSARPQ
jgi:hypothetical protein